MNVPHKTHDLLDHPALTHGFFGRHGGVSSGKYASLNAGFGSGDEPANVAQNRKRIASIIGTTPDKLLSLHQIHSTHVINVKKPFDVRPKADGMVTTLKGVALTALSADCGPILMADINAGVIGACHAGWRGAVAGIAIETVKAMEILGATRGNICAVLGPCISQENYEVGHDFRDTIVAERERYDAFFRLGPNEKPHFDLKAFIVDQLSREGIGAVEALPECTYGQSKAYFSYRKNTHDGISDYGRNLSAIMLR